MAIPPDVDDYLRESIQHLVGLPVSEKAMQLKLRSLDESNDRLREQVLQLQGQLREKDEKIRLSMAEAAIGAQAVKKQISEYQRYVEENEMLRLRYDELVHRCEKLDEECGLYDRDREALMEFGNEAEERAREAEARAATAEEKAGKLAEELESYKGECESLKEREAKASEEVCSLGKKIEELDRKRRRYGSKSERTGCSRCAVLAKENKDLQSRLTSTAIRPKDYEALVAKVKMLQEDKENLRLNLKRAEEEVALLSDENRLLDEENKSIMRRYKDKKRQSSSGTQSQSISTKSKRERRSKAGIHDAKVLDFNDSESPRQPLQPIPHNSPVSRTSKK